MENNPNLTSDDVKTIIENNPTITVEDVEEIAANSGYSDDKVDELRMYPPLPHILSHFSSFNFKAKLTKEIEDLMLVIIYTSMCQQLATELPVKTWNVIFFENMLS